MTISRVPPLLHKLLSNLEGLTCSSGNYEQFSLAFHDEIKKRLGYVLETENYALCAAALDPRVKLSEIASPDVVEKVWCRVGKMAEEYTPLCVSDGGMNLGGGAEKDVVHRVRSFFESEGIEMWRDKCPLEFWKEQFNRAPLSMALKPTILALFSIQASSTASERLFSDCGGTSSKQRTRMMPELLDSLVCIKGIMKSPPPPLTNYRKILRKMLAKKLMEKDSPK